MFYEKFRRISSFVGTIYHFVNLLHFQKLTCIYLYNVVYKQMCQNIQEYAISNDLTFKNIKINELSTIINLLTIKKNTYIYTAYSCFV